MCMSFSIGFEVQKKDKRINISFSDKLVKKAKNKAEKLGIDYQAYIRVSIESLLLEIKKGKNLRLANEEWGSLARPVNIRISSLLMDELKKVAKEKNCKYQRLIRHAVEISLE